MIFNRQNRPPNLIWILLSVVCSAGLLFITAAAAPVVQDPTPSPQPEAVPPASLPMDLSISDEVCLGCHGQPGTTMVLENGDILDLYVPEEEHANSIHGELGYACVQCHTTVGEYPHPSFSAKDTRDVSVQLYTACKRCHDHQYDLAQDSAHAAAFNSGNHQAAICTDCHTAHDVRQLSDPETGKILPDARIWIPETCRLCHSAIYTKYESSVHGSALTDGNPDVPTCIDCHGVHNIEDPRTEYFRLRSPDMCAKCHTDPAIMSKYGISTDVLKTYVADFHGTTIVLFRKLSPDAQTNKPVCYDCHGIHDIVHANDANKGLVVRENLLYRCQECHPDATINFPTSWLSHYIPSPDIHPLVYYVNLFYKILIPGLVGGMGVLVVMDAGRKLINSFNARRSKKESQTLSTASADQTASADPGITETSTESTPNSENSN